MDNPEWLSAKDAAQKLGLSRSVVYQLVASEKIDHYKVGPNGGRIRFRVEDLEAYIAKCRVSQPAAKAAIPSRKEYVSKYDHSKPGRPLRRS
jgi:excisionase family DNA binding protein